MTSRTTVLRRSALVAVALAAATGIAIARSWADGEAPAVAASVPTTEQVGVADLSTTISLDGSVVLDDTTAVVHRIDGATASSGQSGVAATPTATAGGAPSAVVVAAECSVPESTTTTVAGSETTVTDPSATATTIPSSSEASTETTTTTPTTTAVTATTPTTPSTDAPCTDAATTTTTLAAGPSAPSGSPTAAPIGGSSGAAVATGSTSSSVSTELVTSVRSAGTAVALGDVLYTVDGHPVVVLHGALPAWRTLSTESDDGADIRQLEESLAALGYDADGELTIDDTFDSDTADAVEQWQEGLGTEPTGEVVLGSVVFLAADATLSTVSIAVGDEIGDGTVVATVAASSQEVVVEVPSEDQQFVAVGSSVELDGVTGTVTRLRSGSGTDGVRVEAVISPATPIAAAREGTVVKARITAEIASAVTVVPVEAISSRLDGTYAVELLGADGTTRWVTVEIVGQSGTDVGVRGDGIAEGVAVVVPE